MKTLPRLVRPCFAVAVALLAAACGGPLDETDPLLQDDQELTPLYTIAIVPASVTVNAGGSAKLVLSSKANGTSVKLLNLSVSGLPAGVSASFNPLSIAPGKSSTLTLTAAPGAASTSVWLTVKAASARTSRSIQAGLVVKAGGGGGGVGPSGGTVDLLHFMVTGDTRPPACSDTQDYPTAIINAIADAALRRDAQFALDLGDHMYVCSAGFYQQATDQMNLYMAATKRFGRTWFMTMGNHECYGSPCLLENTSANYTAYMTALAPISSKPYYSFDVQTKLGQATFVVIADNAWDSRQESWLQQTLSDADNNARYTIVLRHHPSADSSVATNSYIMQIIRSHKLGLFLSGHSHLYKHSTADNGRNMILGVGGAPLASGGTFNGYAMIDQLSDGNLKIGVYNLEADVLVDSFIVGPNP